MTHIPASFYGIKTWVAVRDDHLTPNLLHRDFVMGLSAFVTLKA
jgi:hypothetical protein